MSATMDLPTTSGQLTLSTLHIHKLKREDLGGTLTCTSSNNISSPAETSVVLNLNLKPLTVKIRRGEAPISAGIPAEIVCEVSGSRPAPSIEWYKGTHQLNQTFVYVSLDGNVTTSVVSFVPSGDDHGQRLACRAKNPKIEDSLEEDIWEMNVQYKPKISLQLGANLNIETIQENNDVYLECQVDGNPAVDEVSWQFNDHDLLPSSNVLLSKKFLVIQQVQTHHSGYYSCIAENPEGRTQGDKLFLRVQHAPLCKENQNVIYAASRHQEVEIHCEVVADPTNVTFEWRFNSTIQHREISNFSSHGTKSTARYIPHTHTEYGTLLCTASNRIGKQKQPCIFHVVQAGPPGPVENCSITNQTEGSLHLECQPGPDGHLTQHFHLNVYEATTRTHISNQSADFPDFWVHNLLPGVEYYLVIWAGNDKGKSPNITIQPPIMPLVGKLIKSGNNVPISSNALLVTVISCVVVLCLLPVFVLLAVKLKNKRFFAKAPENKEEDGGSPSTTAQQATQLQISSIYPKEDNQLWIVKKSTGL